jgi:hypothetical protein
MVVADDAEIKTELKIQSFSHTQLSVRASLPRVRPYPFA